MLKKIGITFPRDIPFVVWIALLLVALAVGGYAAAIVLIRGLVVTNLTDQVPWGLWITVDISAIALSGGAFFLSALVHIVGIKRFKPIAKLAVFIGLLGYTTAVMTLLLDIGRPDRFWVPLTSWNTHSMLWEVTMCVILYLNVLLLEVFPLVTTHKFFDRLPRIRRLAEFLHRGAPALAFLGLFFSALHQSSIGGTFGVVIARPIWFRPTMPLMFIASAMAVGPALVIVAALVVGLLRGYDIVPRDVLFDVGRIAGAVLLIYLYMRFWDTMAGNYGYVPLRTEATEVLTRGEMALLFWSWEVIFGGVFPAILLLWAATARSEAGLFIGGTMAVIGLALNRWNTTLVGLTTPLMTDPVITYPLRPSYTPSWIEWAAAIGLVSGALLVFTLGMRYLPAFGPEAAQADSHAHSGAD
jgi:Ni/Fe-hydrogenase subunit HybB-like protein